MATFNEDFQTDTPQGDSLASDIDIFINAQTKGALNERLSLEHYNLETGVDSTTIDGGQGRHIAGVVGMLGEGTIAVRDALTLATQPGIGAMWVSTNVDAFSNPAGTCFRYNDPGGWEPANFGTGAVYADAATVEAGTEALQSISPLTLRQADWEYVDINTGSNPINRSVSNGSLPTPYTIASFQNTAVTVVPSEIRTLIIRTKVVGSNNYTATITADIPLTGATVVAQNEVIGVGISCTTDYIVHIPINKGQTIINIDMVAGLFSTAEFTVIGAIQRTWAE